MSENRKEKGEKRKNLSTTFLQPDEDGDNNEDENVDQEIFKKRKIFTTRRGMKNELTEILENEVANFICDENYSVKKVGKILHLFLQNCFKEVDRVKIKEEEDWKNFCNSACEQIKLLLSK
jgi:hypothetical protein